MYIKSQNLKQLYRIIFLLCCEAGMILQYIDSLRRGNADTLLYYYTVQSGILCFLYFFFLAVFSPKKEKAVIRGAVTMCIAVTAIAYLFMPNGAKEAAASDKAFYTGYILMHYIVPLMVILDYLLFFPKGLYKALHPLCWLILPYLYIAFTMICAKFGSKIFSAFGGLFGVIAAGNFFPPWGAASRYPYPFLDADLYGKNKVALIIVFITAAFLALGYLSFVIDRLLGKNGKKLK